MNSIPWASFCMSTYKRPDFLKTQISILLQQTFQNIEIVISDNDELASGKTVADSFNDPRVQYYCNNENLGMVKSFNKSIDRARGEYIIMVTDDDPVDINLVSVFFNLINTNPGYSLYGGFGRRGKQKDEIELWDKDHFLLELLDPDKTYNLLWSSCLLKKEALVQAGKLADYGGPHLVDHAMMAMTGSISGGVMVNRMYSSINSHQSNFSKSNIEVYYKSCKGFYDLISDLKNVSKNGQHHKILIKHLNRWFITSMFNLRKHFSSKGNKDIEMVRKIDEVSLKIMKLPFMKTVIPKYYFKISIFTCKKILRLI
jgi:glycosyltransferase involved in cell wall biosynthesis